MRKTFQTKLFLKQVIWICVIITVMLSATGCSPANAILGRWEKSVSDQTLKFDFAGLEFFNDGTVIATTLQIISFAGTYKFTDDSHIQVEWDGLGKALGVQLYGVKITGDRMILTYQGIAVEFKKSK